MNMHIIILNIHSFSAPKYRKWTVTENSKVTHDTRLLRLRAPSGYISKAPIGYHIHIIHDISGVFH